MQPRPRQRAASVWRCRRPCPNFWTGADNALRCLSPVFKSLSLTLTFRNNSLAVLYSAPRKPGDSHRGATMSSNKKSSLTGYLPDILMAAAAVRFAPSIRASLRSFFAIFLQDDDSLHGLRLTCQSAPDSLLRHPQPPLAPRPRSPAERRSTRQSLGRKPQTRRHTDE